MVKDPSKLKWTKKQTKIYDLLQQGMKTGSIRKLVGCGYSLVQDVKNAIALGHLPKKYLPKIANKSKQAGSVVDANDAENIFNKPPELVNNEEDPIFDASQGSPVPVQEKPEQSTEQLAIQQPRDTVSHVEQKETVKKEQPINSNITTLSDSATMLRAMPVAVTIPLTPIMMNARSYCLQELKWPDTVHWEDMLDTIIVNYFRSFGVELRGWYKLDEKGLLDSPKPAGGNGNGNGHKNEKEDIDPKILAQNVLSNIIELAKSGQI